MNMTIAELLAFDVAPADASLHIELSKDEHTQYSTLSSTRCPVLLKGRPMELSDTSRGEAGLEISNTEQGRSAVHSRVLKGLVQSMGPSRFEDIAGTARSFRWTGDGQVARALTTNEIQKNAYIEDGRIQEKLPERDKQYGALAQRYPHFGSLDGGAVTTTTTSEIGSLVCFGLKRGMHSISCDQTAYGEEVLFIGIVTTNHCNQDTLASLVLLSNVVVQELRLIKKTCYSTHLIDGTMPFRMINGRQVIESLGPSTTTYRSTTDLTSCYPDERLISTSAHAEQRFAAFGACPACEMPPAEPLQAAQMPPRKQGSQLQQKGSLTTKQRASQQSKEGLFEAWSHAQHQPKRRAPRATFDRPPRARKRSERVFEDF
ncbi:BQ5605_C002g01003 [Microbotryum silenes-dioicae]|uniref:BQ5605_C002g01003 protein n=1 Tax=Microbotryum silenes-dioicae TaxID=796604 RepID=A0A2X0LXI5_9BASI|nr:BQ5605_C002g01003 [Microbotryum silenes-dioicae]